MNALSANKLSTRCFNALELAWSKVDKNKTNECSGKDIQDCYKLDCAKFLEYFAGTQGNNLEGKVSRDEFEQHYREVATSVPNDDYFIDALSKEWDIREAEDA